MGPVRLQAAPSLSRPLANERNELSLAHTGGYLSFARISSHPRNSIFLLQEYQIPNVHPAILAPVTYKGQEQVEIDPDVRARGAPCTPKTPTVNT